MTTTTRAVGRGAMVDNGASNRATMDPTAAYEFVTPSLAQAYLDTFETNRRHKPHVHEQMTRDMKEDRWSDNGAPLRFYLRGPCFDGEHRLRAIIASGIAQRMLVIRGLPDAAGETTDIGTTRTASDILTIKGVTSAHAVAAAAAMLWRYDRGALRSSARPSKPEVFALLRQCPTLHDSVVYAGRAGNVVSIGILGFVHFKAAQTHPDLANAFVDLLGSGADMPAKHPVLVLRERLLGNRQAKAKLRQYDLVGLAIKSWNAFVEGRPLKVLGFRSNEEFPEFL